MRETAKTSLNPMSEADYKDDSAVLESLEEFSNPFAEPAENLKALVHSAETHSSGAFSDPTSTSSSSSETATPEVDSLTMEAELVIKHLREARLQVLKSNDLGPSKKLLEALMDIIIEEFHDGVYEEEDGWVDKLLFKKRMIGLICFLLMLMVWFLNRTSNEPPST